MMKLANLLLIKHNRLFLFLQREERFCFYFGVVVDDVELIDGWSVMMVLFKLFKLVVVVVDEDIINFTSFFLKQDQV